MSTFWEGKKVIVTGGAGMVGFQLVKLLVEAKADVLVIDNLSRTTKARPKINRVKYVVEDAGCLTVCQHHFRDAFAIFNLAASVGGLYFNLNSQATQYWENMRLLSVPALVASDMDIPHFLQVSSVCVYSAQCNDPASEIYGHVGMPERANEGYAWAKRMGEKVAHWAFQDKGHMVIVRPTNCYGEWDYFDEKAHVIPALIRKFASGDKVTVFGRRQRREFIHSLDLAKGMMAALEKGHKNRAYNLGTGGETQVTICELAQMIGYHFPNSPYEFDEGANIGDTSRSTNVSLAKHDLDWEYKIGLEEGLDRVITSLEKSQ